MKRFSTILIAALLIGMSFFFISCEEDPGKSIEENIQATTDIVIAEISYWDVYNIIDKAARDSALWKTGVTYIDSADIFLNIASNGFSIQYGTDSVLCPDGKYRSGSIEVSLSGDYMDPGTVLTIAFLQYRVGSYALSGTQTLNNLGKNSNDEWEVQMSVSNGQVSGPEGVIAFSTQKTFAWIQGLDTPEALNDDVYIARSGGTTSGTTASGVAFQVSITTDVRYERICKWISSGVLQIDLTGLLLNNGTADFGDGTCDSKVMVNFDGIEMPVYMD
jgi:hypothetical protein